MCLEKKHKKLSAEYFLSNQFSNDCLQNGFFKRQLLIRWLLIKKLCDTQ